MKRPPIVQFPFVYITDGPEGFLKLPQLTTVQRDALVNVVNGYKIYNSTLGTTHTIIPDINGFNGLCNWVETLTTMCPQCGLARINREFWATEDYAIMYCSDCKFYTWKDHHSNIEKAHKLTNFNSIANRKRRITIPEDWRFHV